jgi:hypothetical protein
MPCKSKVPLHECFPPKKSGLIRTPSGPQSASAGRFEYGDQAITAEDGGIAAMLIAGAVVLAVVAPKIERVTTETRRHREGRK